MHSHTEAARRMFQPLTQQGINVQMINTSEMQLTVVVDDAHREKGLAALKQEFADALM